MIDYQKYINALRKCAKEHENDRTFTGHVIVSDLCRDTANLLETLEQEPCKEGEYLKSAMRISKNIPKEMVKKVFFDIQENEINEDDSRHREKITT